MIWTWFGKKWWSDVKCNKYQQMTAKTCSSWWLISAPKQSVTQIACDGSTYTKNQIEMPSWQHHISRQSSEKPRWKNLVGAPPLSCALRPREKGHPNASSRTHWNLNIDLMSSFVKPVPICLNTFNWDFGLLDRATIYAIMEHISKINHAHLRLIIGFPLYLRWCKMT